MNIHLVFVPLAIAAARAPCHCGLRPAPPRGRGRLSPGLPGEPGRLSGGGGSGRGGGYGGCCGVFAGGGYGDCFGVFVGGGYGGCCGVFAGSGAGIVAGVGGEDADGNGAVVSASVSPWPDDCVCAGSAVAAEGNIASSLAFGFRQGGVGVVVARADDAELVPVSISEPLVSSDAIISKSVCNSAPNAAEGVHVRIDVLALGARIGGVVVVAADAEAVDAAAEEDSPGTVASGLNDRGTGHVGVGHLLLVLTDSSRSSTRASISAFDIVVQAGRALVGMFGPA